MTQKSFVSIVATAATLLISQSALAGTVLKFQNGAVTPKAGLHTSHAFANVSDDYVVQFADSVTEADKATLKAAGIQVFRYVPDDALIVRATPAQLQKAQAQLRLNAAVPFKGAMKLSGNLPSVSVFSRIQNTVFVISHLSADDAKATAEYLKDIDADATVFELNGKILVARMNQALIPTLTELRGVEFIEKAEKIEPLHATLDEASTEDNAPAAGDYTDLDGSETGTRVMNFDAIWALGYKGEGQTVGMADTGLDSGSTATVAADFQGIIKNGFFYSPSNGSWQDPMGHGTHVAGSIVGRGVSSKGKLKGGAHESMFVPQSLWSKVIDNLSLPAKLGDLFSATYNEGARIHTNSWGKAANFGVYESTSVQVDEYMWNNPDMLILFAAGNSGVDKNRDGVIDSGSVCSPGTAKNALTVGASENVTFKGGNQKFVKEMSSAPANWPAEPIWSSKLSDNAEGLAMFSSRGPTRDGRLKPEIVAPGTNILSNRSHVPGSNPMWGAYNADYTWAGGTSMATPLTAGAAAVTRELLIKKFGIANPTAALVKATLMHTAHDLFPGQYGQGTPTQELKVRRPNSDEGYGRVDMKAIADLTSESLFLEKAIAQGEIFAQSVQVTDGKLLVNLVYTDAPGSPTAAQALVNNLDLTVIGSDGTVYGKPDAINNSEIVELSGLPAGIYTVNVKGTKIPMGNAGKQPFALVVTAF